MSRNSMERRVLPNDEAELRLHEGEDGPRLEGYAAVFNSKSQDLGGFREVFMEGAFEDAIDGSDIRSLFNHDPSAVLGRESNGTLDLSVDKRGLRYRVDLPNTPTAQEVRELVARRDVTGSSLTFNVSEDGDTFESRGDGMVRFVESVDRIGDVGPVTYPAYQATEVSARAVDLAQMEERQSEPSFQGTESVSPDWADGEWGRPNLSDHREVDEGETWEDLAADDRQSIAARFIVGTADADTYGELRYPVVNPETGRLNRNGLLAARQRAAAEDDEEVEAIADSLWAENFEDEDSDRDLYLYDVEREEELIGP